MSKEEALERIVEAVDNALCNYSSANVDVIKDEETNMLDVFYHSRHNSFCIESDVVSFDSVDLSALEIELEERDVGYVW